MQGSVWKFLCAIYKFSFLPSFSIPLASPLAQVAENLSPDTPCTPPLFPQTQAALPADRPVPLSSADRTDLTTETPRTQQSADRTDLTTKHHAHNSQLITQI